MGGGTFNPGMYAAYSASTVGMSTAQVFRSTSTKKELNPLDVSMRESRDSVDNPASTAIAVFFDVTGSMQTIPDYFVRTGLGVLFNGIFDRKPVSDPHIMVGAIGDVYCDRAPLQVSQFEADNRIVGQLADLYLEGGGGGNSSESYTLPWWFAAMHTSIDCFEKRGKKGFLFTIGDEECPPPLTPEEIKRVCGDDVTQSMSNQELLDMVSRTYHVFHIMVEQGTHMRYDGGAAAVKASWDKILGQRAILLSDYTKLSEVIISTIQVVEGENADKVAASWDGDTSAVVGRALANLPPSAIAPHSGASGAPVRL